VSFVTNPKQPIGVKSILKRVKSTHTDKYDGRKSGLVQSGYGGCAGCPFISTFECPHGIKVGHTHANGACSKFVMLIKEVAGQHYVGITKQKQYMALIKAEIMNNHMYGKFQETGKIDPQHIEWSKHVLDALDKIRKQEEGSKLTIRRSLSPSDVAEAIKNASIIDVSAEPEEDEEDDYDIEGDDVESDDNKQ